MRCRWCRKEIEKGEEQMLETLNCIFHLCLDCAIEIEGVIENSLNTGRKSQ